MSDEHPPWAKLLEGLASEHDPAAHPPMNEVLSYVDNELPLAAADAIRDHLSLCRQCREIVLDLKNFPDIEPPSNMQAIDSEQLEDEWQALRARRARSSAADSQATPAVDIDIGRGSGWLYSAGLRAALFATCLGLGLWGASEWRGRRQLVADFTRQTAEVRALTARLDNLIRSRGTALKNLQLIDLPSPRTTRGSAANRRIRPSEDTDGLFWILDIEDLEASSIDAHTLGVEIVDQDGLVLWSETGLYEVEAGSITFVTVGILAEGNYWVRLVLEAEAVIAEYPVTILENNKLANDG